VSKTPDLTALFGSQSNDTFMGLSSCDDLHQLESPVAMIGVPCATPYQSVGAYCANGPRAVRQGMAAFAANLDHYDFDNNGKIYPDQASAAVDCGDLDCDEADPEANRTLIRNAISTILARRAKPRRR